MRVITGRARGTKLFAPEGYETTRPTADMVKEAVFSIIQFDITGKNVLDLFAGSGQMGIEAVSRGANSAVLVDRDKEAVKVIKENVSRTHFEKECRVVLSDYAAFIRLNPDERFDIVFIDPPYSGNNAYTALKKLCESDLLNDNAFIIVERGDEEIFEEFPLTVFKHRKYGKSFITVYKKEITE